MKTQLRIVTHNTASAQAEAHLARAIAAARDLADTIDAADVAQAWWRRDDSRARVHLAAATDVAVRCQIAAATSRTMRPGDALACVEALCDAVDAAMTDVTIRMRFDASTAASSWRSLIYGLMPHQLAVLGAAVRIESLIGTTSRGDEASS
jgi:hypothetical protein